jgi:hypothetical protein
MRRLYRTLIQQAVNIFFQEARFSIEIWVRFGYDSEKSLNNRLHTEGFGQKQREVNGHRQKKYGFNAAAGNIRSSTRQRHIPDGTSPKRIASIFRQQ